MISSPLLQMSQTILKQQLRVANSNLYRLDGTIHRNPQNRPDIPLQKETNPEVRKVSQYIKCMSFSLYCLHYSDRLHTRH
jgi:hypothetical protein